MRQKRCLKLRKLRYSSSLFVFDYVFCRLMSFECNFFLFWNNLKSKEKKFKIFRHFNIFSYKTIHNVLWSLFPSRFLAPKSVNHTLHVIEYSKYYTWRTIAFQMAREGVRESMLKSHPKES